MKLFELTEEIEGLFYNKSILEQKENALILIGTILANADKLDYKRLLNLSKERYEEFLDDWSDESINGTK
jgi:hypothetical protein